MLRSQIALCAAVIVLIAYRLSPAAEPAATSPDAPRISVLFLGDAGHHRPAERARQLVPILADRGIDVTYSESVDDLNSEKLKRYDALAVYANIERISPEQEAALLGYVESGGGLVALHCASFCFLNSQFFIFIYSQ